MRLNLLYNQTPINGYTNIDPLNYSDNNIINRLWNDLDDIVSDAEATEIIADDLIDYIANYELENYIKYWISKLRHHGKLVIGGLNIIPLSKDIISGNITINDVNHYLYREPTKLRCACYSNIYIANLLEQMGLKILFNYDNISTNKYHYNIVAMRL